MEVNNGKIRIRKFNNRGGWNKSGEGGNLFKQSAVFSCSYHGCATWDVLTQGLFSPLGLQICHIKSTGGL